MVKSGSQYPFHRVVRDVLDGTVEGLGERRRRKERVREVRSVGPEEPYGVWEVV